MTSPRSLSICAWLAVAACQPSGPRPTSGTPSIAALDQGLALLEEAVVFQTRLIAPDADFLASAPPGMATRPHPLAWTRAAADRLRLRICSPPEGQCFANSVGRLWTLSEPVARGDTLSLTVGLVYYDPGVSSQVPSDPGRPKAPGTVDYAERWQLQWRQDLTGGLRLLRERPFPRDSI